MPKAKKPLICGVLITTNTRFSFTIQTHSRPRPNVPPLSGALAPEVPIKLANYTVTIHTVGCINEINATRKRSMLLSNAWRAPATVLHVSSTAIVKIRLALALTITTFLCVVISTLLVIDYGAASRRPRAGYSTTAVKSRQLVRPSFSSMGSLRNTERTMGQPWEYTHPNKKYFEIGAQWTKL
ncbi:hypothetical protein EVAR_27944_1 [Eumeta japonica]|uniref:Uncharacterized protein n=1 Tax=Eumeta variegata TaxID=151549 RepID=A0A4C1UVS1_EUMVA|nr:hypothetical protein EVAR_27944_1 [Eumeta japonica]